MADSTSTPSSANQNKGSIHKGMKLPRFKAGAGPPNVFSAGDMNIYPAALEALLNCEVVIDTAVADSAGNFTPTGTWEISDQNCRLHLYLSPGQTNTGGVQIFVDGFASSYANYFITQGGIRVGKWPSLYNISTDTQYGKTRTFVYPHNLASDALYGQYRTASISGFPNEHQGINPEWNVGDAIFYVAFATGLTIEAQDVTDNGPGTINNENITTSDPIVFQDLNNAGRAWMQFYDQTY
jgi:hypothetical protein